MPTAIRSGRFYCNIFFFAAGVGLGSWASCLPVLSAQNSLEKGELGLILLCFALGAIVAMTNVGRLTARFSCSTLSLVGAMTFGAALVIVPFVSGNAWLASIVSIAGSGFGTLDVSMNTEASALERRAGRHLMSSFHAMFSFGNLAGAFTVGQILSHGGALVICLGATGAGVATFAIVASQGSSRNADPADAIRAGASNGGRLDSAQKPYLYLIGAIAFLSMLGEGGIMDWSAIYIVNVFSGTDSAGAYGFAVFATMMAFGRLFGDAITTRIVRHGSCTIVRSFVRLRWGCSCWQET